MNDHWVWWAFGIGLAVTCVLIVIAVWRDDYEERKNDDE